MIIHIRPNVRPRWGCINSGGIPGMRWVAGRRGSFAHHAGGGGSSVDREFEYPHSPRGGIGRCPYSVRPHILSGREELKHSGIPSPSYETKNWLD